METATFSNISEEILISYSVLGAGTGTPASHKLEVKSARLELSVLHVSWNVFAFAERSNDHCGGVTTSQPR